MRKIHGKMDVANRDPSLMTSKPMVYEDNSYKQEVSKKYTVAVAYNKGGYQVIPSDQVKYIGKK